MFKLQPNKQMHTQNKAEQNEKIKANKPRKSPWGTLFFWSATPEHESCPGVVDIPTAIQLEKAEFTSIIDLKKIRD